MKTLNKWRKFLSMDTDRMLILIEAFIYLGCARMLVLLPFKMISPSLGHYMQETPQMDDTLDRASIKKVSYAVHTMSRHTIWDSKCLVRAIAGMKMLRRRHIESTLYLGTAREKSGEMAAHAWLRSGDFYITGAEEMKRFTVVGKFAKTVHRP
ncbi:lasso peptide biosynthesis B2 protein [Paenibacillus sp. SI8]|uniref:lasso peptide biosynthesis B2 protein n=1 Tax=unclassified Paenibacillus TaxID=185978 RepID=UPI003467CE2A